ncbi:MAG TPA: hypothetical protein VF329_07415 [Gammaproteobacteria bacterium]
MNRAIYVSSLAAASWLGFAAPSWSDTITAGSCSQSDVQAAIDSSADGDDVIVPNGSCTWTSNVSIRGKGIHLHSASVGGVTITHSAGSRDLLIVLADQSHNVEISGFRFLPGSVSNPAHYILVEGIGKPVLVHDLYMRIEDFGVSCIRWGARGGVIWNNVFESRDRGGAGSGCLPIKAESNEFDVSWTTPSTFGTDDVGGDQNVYIEDNTFRAIIYQAIDPDGNARVVIRHNTFDNSAMASHGADTGPDGMRHAEVYDNRFIFTASGSEYDFPLALNNFMYIRGGSWVITDNEIDDIRSQLWGDKDEIMVTVQNLRRRSGPYPCWTTYPVPRQFGQGYDTAPTLEPAYIWNNTGDGQLTPQLSDYDPDQCGNNLHTDDFVQEGRDYFLEAKPGYRKYPYPHPLRDDRPAPKAPSGLQVN